MELLKYVFLGITIAACATRIKDSSTSNYKREAPAGKKAAHSESSELISLRTIKPGTVFNWQSFFKSPPSAKERPALASSVTALAGAVTALDLIKRARNEVAIGRFAGAEASYREALRKDRKNIDAMIELAGVFHRIKNSDAAIQVLSDIRETLAEIEGPDRVNQFRYQYILALVLIQRGDREKGHEILSNLIGQEKTFAPGYAALASSYLAIGKDQIAKFIVERGLDRSQEDASLYNLLGVVAERAGKLSLAREYFNKSLANSDSFAPALVNRANMYIKSKEFRLAEGDLKRALEIDPLNIDAMISMAVVQRQSGRFEMAKGHLNRVLEIQPDSAEARFNLANLMRDNIRNTAEAMRLFSEVAQTDNAPPDLRVLARSAMEELKNL